MSRAIFLMRNFVDYGAVIASSESPPNPARNVQTAPRSRVWRSGPGGSSRLDIELDAARLITHCAIVDANLTATGAFRLQGWTDAIDGAVEVFDESFAPTLLPDDGEAPPALGLTLRPVGAAGITARWWRLTLSDPATAYQQCGRVILSEADRPAINLSYGWQVSREELTAIRSSIGGQAYSQPRTGRTRISGRFEYLTTTEAAQMAVRLRQFGTHRPFVAALHPDDTDAMAISTAIYGTWDGPSVSRKSYQTHPFDFTVVEAL